jgi:DNA-binding MarR family transcriptional regulator
METNTASTSTPSITQFVDLLQRFIRLRPKLIFPDHVVRFKQQMIEKFRNSTMGGVEDYHFIFHIFVILSQKEKPPTMGELSAELNTPFSTSTRIVDGLVQGQFLERFSDTDDRRVVRVRMTETGRSFYQTFLGFNQERIELLLKDFSDEEKSQLYFLMNKLLDSMCKS